jgi:hypothetical protein
MDRFIHDNRITDQFNLKQLVMQKSQCNIPYWLLVGAGVLRIRIRLIRLSFWITGSKNNDATPGAPTYSIIYEYEQFQAVPRAIFLKSILLKTRFCAGAAAATATSTAVTFCWSQSRSLLFCLAPGSVNSNKI